MATPNQYKKQRLLYDLAMESSHPPEDPLKYRERMEYQKLEGEADENSEPTPEASAVFALTMVSNSQVQPNDVEINSEKKEAESNLDDPSSEKHVKIAPEEGAGATADASADEIETVVEMRKKTQTREKGKDIFFRDGKRKIDYVLAYKLKGDEEYDAKRGRKRKQFELNLKEEGLELEYEDAGERATPTNPDDPESADGKTFFVKIHAPWKVLCRMAAEIKLKKPIQENDLPPPRDLLDCIPHPFNYDADLITEETNYFTAAFDPNRLEEFIIEDRETFFTTAERIRMVYEILERTRYDPDNKNKFGVDHLVGNGSYAAAYPLHDGDYKSKHSILSGAENDRHLLHETWGRFGMWYKFQPLDQVRAYFGEKIALYFAWLGFYTYMLVPASILGIVVFIYGCATLGGDDVSGEICDSIKLMCPLCNNKCPYFNLSDSCTYAQLTYVFDNNSTVFYACFMALWSTMFCEMWKRKQAEIDYDWDLFGFEDQEENTRPEYEASAPDKRVNPITQLTEPYLAFYKKFPRLVASVLTILFMISLVFAAVLGVIIYRIAVRAALAAVSDSLIASQASLITSLTASCISVTVIVLLQFLYEKIATWLTDLELHRTETSYEDSYTFKMYLFGFANYYSSSFYIAFLKGRLPGAPNNPGTLFGMRQEECDAAGCLQELFINVAVVMCGKQVYSNALEIFVPLILNWMRGRSARKQEEEGNVYEQWEKDFDLGELGPRGLFKEYLEMAIQFGWITIFVAAFPLAPFFALVNNLLEIRLDAFKFISQLRRPYAARAQDIGAWYSILLAVGNFSVLSNACIIAFTSEFIPREVYRYRTDPGSLKGYIDFSLSEFNVSDFKADQAPDDEAEAASTDKCFFKGFYIRNGTEIEGEYNCKVKTDGSPSTYCFTQDYWEVFAMRLVFVLVFEHVIFAFKLFLDWLIPDIPGFVSNQIKRENFLAKEALHTAALEKAKKVRQSQAIPQEV
ncbi:anoctamin-4-like isoform X5 [Anneissia japonica]|uniref:anoctamin-4-like isoform X5 n=1 Tax=Anneissia japonica TaxID=1529436 RepID=UPI0014259312|nr:anoctamin-4-like isoform X5 [Anneissia japonica]